jgi:hypothetical protein
LTDEKASGGLQSFGPIQRALARWLDLSEKVPAEHIQLLNRLDQTTEEIGGYKFNMGQAVQFSPREALFAHGLYVVTGLLPERDGEFEYSISNEAEPSLKRLVSSLESGESGLARIGRCGDS